MVVLMIYNNNSVLATIVGHHIYFLSVATIVGQQGNNCRAPLRF